MFIMKAINVVKRIVATGMGLTMVGATIFGASAAYSLSDFPKPFVENGTPASNLAIVVGENAAATDVAGAVDVALALQAAAVTKVPVAGSRGGVTVEGDAVAVGSTSDLLEINEVIGSVRETLTEVDLDMLKGGQIVTDEGSTEYNQYLRLPEDGNGGKVAFGKDERDRVGHYLNWPADTEVFEWALEFEEGLKSSVKDGKLTDFHDQDIMILGQPFVVVNTDIDFHLSKAASSGMAPSRFQVDLMGGAISAILGENDKETYTVDGKEYEVEVLVISETANSGDGAVKFRINGEITDELTDGETDVLADGTQVGIRDIMATGKDIQKSVVQFYLGAYKVSFSDDNISDTRNQSGGVSVNEEIVTKGKVQIKGKSNVVSSGAENQSRADQLARVKEAQIDYIKYFLDADSVLGDVFVPPGSGVREQLQEPEGMLTPAWDIVYQGLTDTGTTTVVVDPRGNDEYNLQFTNQEGIFYDIPLVSHQSPLACLKYGDNNDDLWFIEAANTKHAQVTRRDFFVLSNCNPGTAKNTCFSHVLRYDSIDTTNNKLVFTDLGTGTREVTYDNATRLAELVVGGVTYSVYIDGNVATAGSINLSIDLTGDGDVAGDQAFIGIQGDGLLSLGNNNTNDTVNNGSFACAGNFSVGNATGGKAAHEINITLTTLSKEFDEASTNENITWGIQNRSSNRIGIRSRSLRNATGVLFGLFTLEENEDLEQALSGYGVFFEEFVPTGNTEAESLTIEYPLSQRGGEVFVTGGAIKTSVSDTGFSEKINPIPTTVSMEDSEVDDVTRYNAVVIGGACANTVSAKLVGNPEPCWSHVPENKAVVKAFEHDNGNVALLVAGFTAKDTRRATTALASGQLNSVSGSEAEVTGTSLSDIRVKAV